MEPRSPGFLHPGEVTLVASDSKPSALRSDLISTLDQGFFSTLATHLVVALVALVVIGGATRVMQAGLACPDWPLCYGRWLPGGQMNLQVFLEWFHRLDAFLVGVALFVQALASLLCRRVLPGWFPGVALITLALVVLQAALGALTVTRLLASPLVTAHLGTALLLVAFVSAASQALMSREPQGLSLLPRWWLPLSLTTLLLVMAQCVLGGSLASQWASERCLSSGEGCLWLWRHRQMVVPVVLLVISLALSSLTLPQSQVRLRRLSMAAATLVLAQVGLGTATLRLQLNVPLVTVGHQLLAALLVAVLAAMLGASLAAPRPLNRPKLELAHG